MTSNDESAMPVYRDTVSGLPARSPWRLTAIALALALLLGSIGGGWLALHFFAAGAGSPFAAADPVQAVKPLPAPLRVAGADPRIPALAVAEAGAVSARVSALEERLSRISMAAESASGNAAKAEALLVAFAARRALDRGLPLGSMEAQVRLRFGDTQPNAVQSILSASADPVTQEHLLTRLEALRPILMADSTNSWWTRISHSLSTLVVVRSSSTPSPAPSRRYDRARRAIADGRIDDAIGEIEALPGNRSPLAQAWLTDARRLNDARRALDLIETAAILEPGQNREPSPSAPVPTKP